MSDRDEVPTVQDRSAAPPKRDSAFDPPAERFRPIGELGRGGMGVVEDALDRALGRPVAIKRVLVDDRDDLARFEREARITARLEHPGIVPIHDVGRDPDGRPYYVMRKVEGQRLDDRVRDKSLADRLALVANVLAACDAAGYAHARGVVHRDIKPANILVGPFGETLLIDWGLAREIADASDDGAQSGGDLTRAGQIAGTPGFMAPEQARGERIDASTDVFALGATLFYVLTSVAPYAPGGATQMIEAVGANREPAWKLLPAKLPADLRAILEKALASDRAQRYADGSALAADLRRFLTGNLVGARDYGLLEQLRRYVRRHRAVFGVIAASVVALAVVSIVFLRRVIDERDAAETARGQAEVGRREALAASDRLLIDHASELVYRDPTAALILLRQLRDDSDQWAAAAAIGQAAELRGLPNGYHAPNRSHVAISADSRHLAITGDDSTQVEIVELATGTRQSLTLAGRVWAAAWMTDGRLAVSTDGPALVAIDPADGSQRSRPLPAECIRIVSARDGSIILHLRRWTPAQYSVARLARFDADVVDMPDVHAWEDDVMIVARGNGYALLTATDSAPLEADELTQLDLQLFVRGDHIITAADADVRGWRVRDGKLVAEGRWHQGLSSIVLTSSDMLAVDPGFGVRRFDDNTILDPDGLGVAATADRAAIWHRDGSFTIVDPRGRWRLGPRPLGYAGAVLSPNGRFLVAVTDGSLVLVWDLDRIAPVTLGAGDQSMVDVVDGALWTKDAFTLYRYDLRTHDMRMHPISDLVPGGGATIVFGDGRAAATVYRGITYRVVVHSLDEGPPLADVDDVRAWWHGPDALTLARVDGSIDEWTFAPALTRRTITQVDQPVDYVSNVDGHLVIALADGTIRVVASTGSFETKVRGHVLGAVWDGQQVLAIVDGVVWRISSTTAERIDLPSAAEVVFHADSGSVVALTDMVAVLDGSRARILPRAWTSSSQFSGDPVRPLIGWIGADGEPTVVDMAGGIHMALPTNGTEIALRDGSVFVTRTNDISWWLLRVPRDRVGFRRWLATATNAAGVPSSEAVVWP